MNKSTQTLSVCLCLSLAASILQAAGPFGIWWRAGAGQPDDVTREECPHVRGFHSQFRWMDIEPENGIFDWSGFDREIARRAKSGHQLVKVWVGPHSPEWIYDAGVPRVDIENRQRADGSPMPWSFPYYLDADYQLYYRRMLKAVAERIKGYPPEIRESILVVQINEGATGDEVPYKGRVLSEEHLISPEQWNEFKFDIWEYVYGLYGDTDPKIHLLVNSGNPRHFPELNGWLMEHYPSTWRKVGHQGHGYQLNDEMIQLRQLQEVLQRKDRDGNFVRLRSEFDEEYTGWYLEAPVWNMYWMCLWFLESQLDIPSVKRSVLMNPAHAEGFSFFNTYAGIREAAESPGAFCALRDGLDASDTLRFPVEEFGKGSMSKDVRLLAARMDAIAAAHQERGARNGDVTAAAKSAWYNRRSNAMNDVGWNIHTGNYDLFLTQVNPDSTSAGYWRVGGTDQPFGRFGRGFGSPDSGRAMAFDLDAGVRKPSETLTVRVVYFDQGGGKWALEVFDGESMRTLETVTCGDSGQWVEMTVDLPGADAREHPDGHDFQLRHVGGDDVIFHMIEIRRKPEPAPGDPE